MKNINYPIIKANAGTKVQIHKTLCKMGLKLTKRIHNNASNIVLAAK